MLQPAPISDPIAARDQIGDVKAELFRQSTRPLLKEILGQFTAGEAPIPIPIRSKDNSQSEKKPQIRATFKTRTGELEPINHQLAFYERKQEAE
jgi:hypothetical protein